MAPFMTAVLVCAGIIAWAAMPPHLPWAAFWERPEFWQSWLPAWLQALGLLALAACGWRALGLWRAEVGARHRELLAADVLGCARALAAAVEQHRRAMAGANGPLTQDGPDAGAAPALPEGLGLAAAGLRRAAAPARQHFGGDIEVAMLALAARGEALAEAHAAGRPGRHTDALAEALLAAAAGLQADLAAHLARERRHAS